MVHTNLQITYECNFCCTICDFWQPEVQRNATRLTSEQVRIIGDKLVRFGPQIVSIGGGEPLPHPELMDTVSAIARHHIPVMICSGWFVTPDNAREPNDSSPGDEGNDKFA